MDTVFKKIEFLRNNILAVTESFDYELFLKVLQALEPELQFDDDKKLELFQNLSEGTDGRVSKSEIEKLLNMVENRDRRISSEYIREINLNKLSELKQLYQSCDPQGTGMVKIFQLEKLLNEISHSEGSKEEILYFFRAIAERDTEIVHIGIVSKILSELERRLYQQVSENAELDDTSIDVADFEAEENNLNESHISELNLANETEMSFDQSPSSRKHLSEIGYSFAHSYMLVQGINSKLEELMSLNQKEPFVKKLLFTAHDQVQALRADMKVAETKYDELQAEIEMFKSKEEIQKARMEHLEYELKKELSNRAKILEVTDTLGEENMRLKEQLEKYEAMAAEMEKKNNQIVTLESRCSLAMQTAKNYEEQLAEVEKEKEETIKNYERLEQIVNDTLAKQHEQECVEPTTEEEEDTKIPAAWQDNFNELQKEIGVLKWEINTKNAEIETKTAKIKTLNSKIAELIEEGKSKDEIITALKMEKSRMEFRLATESKPEHARNKSRSFLGLLPKVEGTLDKELGFFNTHESAFLTKIDLPSIPIVNVHDSPTSNTDFRSSRLETIQEVETPSQRDTIGRDFRRNDTFGIIPTSPFATTSIQQNSSIIPDILTESAKKPHDDGEIHEGEPEVLETSFTDIQEADAGAEEAQSLNNNRFSEFSVPKKLEKSRQSYGASLNSTHKLPPFSRRESQFTRPRKDSNITDKDRVSKKLIDNGLLWSMSRTNVDAATNSEADFRKSRISRLADTILYQQGMFTRDYLNLAENPKVVKILQDNKEHFTSNCYSDWVIRINRREKREKRILFITDSALYSLYPKTFEIVRKINLKDIYQVTLPDMSAVHMVIHVKNEYDYFLEVFRRANVVLFLIEIFKLKKLPEFTIKYETRSLKIQNRKSIIPKNMLAYQKETINTEMQEAYRNSKKLGFLTMKTDSWFFSWKQYFFVMIDIGMLYFTGPGKKTPTGFIPILGAKVLELGRVEDQSNCFKIIYPQSNTEFILSANSGTERSEWIKTLKEVQSKAQAVDSDGKFIEKMQEKIQKKIADK